MSDPYTTHLLTLAAAWTGYFAVHSLLASLTVKRLVATRRPDWMPGYRLFFNVASLLLLIPPLALTYLHPGPWLWRWTGYGGWLANAGFSFWF